MMIVPVTGVGTWVFYIKCIVCMLQVWVHCAGISCSIACHGIGTINPDYDCQYGNHIIAFIVWDSVFQFRSFLLNLFLLVSAAFKFSLFLCMIAIHGEFDWRICSSLTVCSQLRYGSSTVTWYLNLNPHICWQGQNRFFYNCSTISHLLFYYVTLLM